MALKNNSFRKHNNMMVLDVSLETVVKVIIKGIQFPHINTQMEALSPFTPTTSLQSSLGTSS